ncbi:hypothetical protein BLNAU_23319 [Blattamonas nauphoetae]|uniref:Uncharacterized protein n=1 Tax=Blattamonas nauphoetae TaxID=2049346 RepID=A0ABQ9WTM4_9EUKA|nr:hypothetical protein BLNAU_23319 [Blattamonas nauphoetae]
MSINPRVFQKSSDARTPHRADSLATIDPGREPFLSFRGRPQLSFEEKLRIYCSLVSLVKAGYPFDKTLQDRAALFLKSLESGLNDKQLADKLVTKLVQSSAGSTTGFVESISTLLSSPHSAIVAASFSFLCRTLMNTSTAVELRLLGSDLIWNLFTALQPHTLSITGNEKVIIKLIEIISHCVYLASPYILSKIRFSTAVKEFNRRERIFQKVVLPSSRFVTFLISNRYSINGDLFDSFMELLYKLIQFGPFHRPTLDFVLASPIAMAFSSCHSFVEDDLRVRNSFFYIKNSLQDGKTEGPEVVQSGKRMIQTLFSEGFEDTLEQKLKYDKVGLYCSTHFCGLSSDVGNAVIAGADEQILGSPPIVKKLFAHLGWSFSTWLSLTVTSSTVLSPNNSFRPYSMHCDQILFPNLDFPSISKTHLVFLVEMKCPPRYHHSTATSDLFAPTHGIYVFVTRTDSFLQKNHRSSPPIETTMFQQWIHIT